MSLQQNYDVRYLIIKSSQRSNKSDPSTDFSIVFDQPLEVKKFIKLQYAQIPITRYNIDGSSYAILMDDFAVFYLPWQNYTIDQLITELNSQYSQSVGYSDISFSFDKQKLKCTIKHALGTNFKMFFQKKLARMLGFSMDTLEGNSEYVSDNCTDFTSDNIFYVNIQGLNNQQYKRVHDQQYLGSFVIQNNSNFGDVLIYKNDLDYNNIIQQQTTFNDMQIKLYDEDQQIIDLNGSEIILTFIYY